MSDEAGNVEILKAAYTRWSDTKGESVDDWLKICADDIDFGSLAQGAAPKVQYLTAYSSRDALKEYFGGLARDWDMLDWHVDQFIAQGDRVVMLGHCSWRAAWKRERRFIASTPRAAAIRRRRIARARPSTG